MRRGIGFWLPFTARALVWSFGAIYFLFILLILSLRYAILPNIDSYRPVIERMIEDNVGRKVSIGRIEAGWAGLHPDLTLYEVRIADAEGRSALAFSRVAAVLSWWSVPAGRLRLSVLRIDAPTLNMRRSGDGRFFIAGIPLGLEGSQEDAKPNGKSERSWLLDLRRIRVSGATLVWEDEKRGAPPLVMKEVNIDIDNPGRRHRFGFTAQPPESFASRIDVRGDFRGVNFSTFDQWTGQIFAEIDYADLAVWKQWVDYPLTLQRGRGAARAWLSLADGELRDVTADVALREVNLQFGEDLPVLDVDSLSGRLQANFPFDDFRLKGSNVTLLSRAGADPIRIEPTDFEFRWRKGREGADSAGSVEVSRLDLEALARLAAYLPFDATIDARLRQLLADCAPRGQVSAASAHWSNNAEKIQTYSLKTDLLNLAMRARGNFPGFSGLTGALEASEEGGRLVLRSGESSIDLPAIFEQSLTRLDSLNAEVNWSFDHDKLRVDLARVDFTSPDAAGSARGTYHAADDGPGVIDMTAALTRADARAVWRYLPNVVGQGARHWLRDSLLAGKATEAQLILKGNLDDFPFLDKTPGQFLVTVKARDAVLDYGAGWPRIDGIQGDLRFEGNGMTIEAREGRILGAKLSNTRVNIPDFDAPVSTLLLKGQADGPTAEFLKFIEQSPVGEDINHFTEDMRAKGNGRLNIDLNIPLDESKLKDSRVAGVFRFTNNNEVLVDAALPPLRQVNGSLRFSGNDLTVPEINALLFGGALKIQGGLQKDGRVLITIGGSADINQLRWQSDHPALACLSGTAPYQGEIRINGRNTEVLVESNLVGLLSTLPEPFAKAADDTLPLRFEKRFLNTTQAAQTTRPGRANLVARDRISVTLGNVLSAQVVRRKTSDGFASERGAVAIGRPLRLPGNGLVFEVSAKRLDLDAWSKLFATASSAGQKQEDASISWRFDTVNLQAGELLVRGIPWNDVELQAASDQGQWKIRLDSRQAKGDLAWDGAGDGRLVANLERLAIERLPPSGAGTDDDATRSLPALDVLADDFSVRRLRFGRLNVQANNDGAGWELEHIEVSNPHGTLTGKGSWQQSGGVNRTRLSFQLDSSDVGGLLARMDYPGTLLGGTAKLDGRLEWDGAPTEIDYASMYGDLKLAAANGQFLKLDPGAAGKLLGLISLQNLRRRFSLDFNDVFSEGLAFDAINGKVAVQKGIMRTDRLRINSPAARVSMRGEVDLARETQRLNVTVQPELSETAALGVGIINPVAGAATWLASKVLRNPLGSMFSYYYLITGAWDNPTIEKIDAQTAGENLSGAGSDDPPRE
ncbi:DUF3971 domain-containing protein [Betaproteobacteria bacterium]|nr:DUF3971 domain-containing protein [Betaproteobacteria bacterium]